MVCESDKYSKNTFLDQLKVILKMSIKQIEFCIKEREV